MSDKKVKTFSFLEAVEINKTHMVTRADNTYFWFLPGQLSELAYLYNQNNNTQWIAKESKTKPTKCEQQLKDSKAKNLIHLEVNLKLQKEYNQLIQDAFKVANELKAHVNELSKHGIEYPKAEKLIANFDKKYPQLTEKE